MRALARYKRADEIQPDKDLLAMLTDSQREELQADLELLKRAEGGAGVGGCVWALDR